jgi:hypothetical protein
MPANVRCQLKTDKQMNKSCQILWKNELKCTLERLQLKIFPGLYPGPPISGEGGPGRGREGTEDEGMGGQGKGGDGGVVERRRGGEGGKGEERGGEGKAGNEGRNCGVPLLNAFRRACMVYFSVLNKLNRESAGSQLDLSITEVRMCQTPIHDADKQRTSVGLPLSPLYSSGLNFVDESICHWC